MCYNGGSQRGAGRTIDYLTLLSDSEMFYEVTESFDREINIGDMIENPRIREEIAGDTWCEGKLYKKEKDGKYRRVGVKVFLGADLNLYECESPKDVSY